MAKIQKIHPLNPKNQKFPSWDPPWEKYQGLPTIGFRPDPSSKQRGTPNFKGTGAFCLRAYYLDGAWPIFK